jgi:hypothetical protein
MRILYYLEPHPIRNSYTEHVVHSNFILPLLDKCTNAGVTYRVLSNHYAIDAVMQKFPELALNYLYPTEKETKQIDAFMMEWGEATIKTWLDLVRGDGEVSRVYEDILERVYSIFPFDLLIGWSDNGAANSFCKKRGLPVMHMELGPTRKPFIESIYFDLAGTNGFCIPFNKGVPEELLTTKRFAAGSWLAAMDRRYNSTEVPGKFDQASQFHASPITEFLWKWPQTLYVPIQLADDLNCLLHSRFDSPKHFLQSSMPAWLDQGYAVVIKGHPAAASRIYNLRRQQELKEYVATLGERVMYVEKTNEADNIALMSQSDFVCSVNSSVGFEALLVGGRPIFYGDAACNVNRLIPNSVDAARQMPDLSAVYDKIASFNLTQFLIDKELLSMESFLDLLMFCVVAYRAEPEAYWKLWRQYIEPHTVGTRRTTSRPAVPLDVIPRLRDMPGVRAERSGDIARLGDLELEIVSNRFKVAIDRCKAVTSAAGQEYDLAGWTLNVTTGQKPLCALIVTDKKVLQANRIVGERPDVTEHFRITGSSCIGIRTKFLAPKRIENGSHELWLIDEAGAVSVVELAESE